MLPESVRVPRPCFVKAIVPAPLLIDPAYVELAAADDVSVIKPVVPVVIVPPEEPLSDPIVLDWPLRSSVPLVIVMALAAASAFAFASFS